MKEWLSLTEYDWAFWIAGLILLAEFAKVFYTYKDLIFNKIGIKTKGMIEKEEFNSRLQQAEDSIEEIKETSKQNVSMLMNHEQQILDQFTTIRGEVIKELGRLNDKMDEQANIIDQNNKASIKTDLAVIKDRLNSAMRYFSQNKDENGNVHIKWSDYEILDDLFKEYFAKGGNGPIKRMYEEEFLHFIIDR